MQKDIKKIKKDLLRFYKKIKAMENISLNNSNNDSKNENDKKENIKSDIHSENYYG
jgi:hypothetical protein